MKIKETKTSFSAITTEDNEGNTHAKIGCKMGTISKKTGKFVGATAFHLPLFEAFKRWKITQNLVERNEITLTVVLKFSENFKAKDLGAIVDNIALGLKDTADTVGITPDDANYFTEEITVTGENYTHRIKLI